ncbi:UbiA family prenyltransferase [Massilia endophytica]|uniref:UbiA family prenyltransferase n=1 Tax=Massilia endophytica TaxID=2899220 RepID=UPI001E4D330C|nr:UbiA family prenyltransferase [Massilia endophytica]UGQ45490.1 UbiA family prenyltransferase [Massilia endophytica]
MSAADGAGPAVQPPLVIDLDGTLLRSDLLLESALGFARSRPFSLAPLGWLASGKAVLKARLAQSVPLDAAALPYDPQVLALIERERATGRRIVLATASHQLYAEQVAQHLKLFDLVLATGDGVNLSAHRKRERLVQLFGHQGFDYAGNSLDDIAVWGAARQAYVVNASPLVRARAAGLGNVVQELRQQDSLLPNLLRAMRPHQWVKNLLLFVPLMAAHLALQPESLLAGLLAFLCFGLCASSVYLLNDLLDVADDRHHHSKRRRPFASGALPLHYGLLGAPLLLAAAFGLAATLLPWQFGAALGAYYVLTLAYSLRFKRVMALDTITLALLYTLRLIAGAFAFAVPLTSWLLAFSMFIFLSLALVKRFAELKRQLGRGTRHERARGRGYTTGDLDMLSSLGAASGYLSVMVLALYINDSATAAMYRRPQLIWLACPLLLHWITRTWLITHRGNMHDDPVVFAMKDRTSLMVGGLFAAIFWLAA